MTPGPHVFGNGRFGLWIQENSGLTAKLQHILPRLRGAVPNLTDIFIPPTAVASDKQRVRDAGFFCHLWVANHSRGPLEMADYAVQRHSALGTGALELNIEGMADDKLAGFITSALKRVRMHKPKLAVRVNVVPFKGEFLPRDLINVDPNLYVIAQAYGGNMDTLYAADEVMADLTDWGIIPAKASVMHAIMCAAPGKPRQITLPSMRRRGSLYIDDLLLDSGLI